MSIRRRIIVISLALGSGFLLIGLAVLFIALGLDGADKLGSVLGAFSGFLGLAIGGFSLAQARNMQREATATGSEQILRLTRAMRPAPLIPVQAKNSLPANIPDFVNREEALTRIENKSGETSSGVNAVCTVTGMAGVGKTALAIRAAHSVGDSYPDGKFFLNLHAYSPDRAPVPPKMALEALLRAIGFTTEQIPESLEERIALWRSETANTRTILLLDNAIDSEQVLPLIPAGPSLAIVTSRRRLVLDGGGMVALSALADHEAVRLLIQATGGDRMQDAPDEVRSIVSRCGCLPLAVRLVARHFERHPAWSPENLLSEMAAAQGRSEGLATGQEELMAAFQLSYEGLAPGQRRLLRRLALHPSHDFGVDAAAALDDTNVQDVTVALDALADQNLIEEPAHRRYQLHDLIREYALHRTQGDTADEVQAAENRLVDYYTVMGLRAERFINLLGFRNLESSVEWRPTGSQALSSHAEANAWMETERPNLHACVELAVDAGQLARAALLVRAMIYFLRLKGFWDEASSLCRRAARWCEELDDHSGLADMKFIEGDIARLVGRDREAFTLYRQTLAAYQDLGDQHCEARTLHSIGDLERAQRQYEAAIEFYTQALTVYRNTGNQLAMARALHSIADTHRLAERPEEAMDRYQTILVTYRELRDPVGEARALHSIADIHVFTGHGQRALTNFQEALTAYRELGDRLGEADALYSLGVAYLGTGESDDGVRYLEDALEVYRSLGDRRQEARTLNALIEAHGAVEEGERQVLTDYEAAIAASRDAEDLHLEAGAEHALGKILLSAGRREEAAEHLRIALALLESLGSPLVNEVRAALDQTM